MGGPFIDPDPAFVAARPGDAHVLEFSMHCIYRPHYVLHTRLFRPQTDDLDLADWNAVDAVATAEERADSSWQTAVIYNCGCKCPRRGAGTSH